MLASTAKNNEIKLLYTIFLTFDTIQKKFSYHTGTHYFKMRSIAQNIILIGSHELLYVQMEIFLEIIFDFDGL